MSTLISAKNGYGSVLSLSTSGHTGTFVATAGITSLNVPKRSLNLIDVTYHNAPDSYDVSVPGGIIKLSPISLTGLMITCSSFFSYTSAFSQYDMKTWMEDGTLIGWMIEIAATSSNNVNHVMYGDGYITDFGHDIPFDEKVGFSATISVTGKPYFGSSTS